ncbi:MAG TPA: thioesterase family protein [Solirubrobacteraceae bacterium]|nr:thioesterase family protein [Solirubrobacteraceae bacterium]
MPSGVADSSLFNIEGNLYLPTEHTRGPWDPRALHGGAPAALLTSCFEKHMEAAGLTFGRLGFEFLRPIPMAPLEVGITLVRSGRRVRELHASLASEGEQIGRADALLVQPVGDGIPVTSHDLPRMAPREGAREASHEAVEEVGPAGGLVAGSAGFGATGMEMKWLDRPWSPGRARVWMRPRMDLLPGEPMSPLARVAAAADFGNGVGAELPFDGFLFINADLTLHLQRAPEGDWVGIDARTLMSVGGPALAESVLHDETGPVGRAFQTLVVQLR